MKSNSSNSKKESKSVKRERDQITEDYETIKNRLKQQNFRVARNENKSKNISKKEKREERTKKRRSKKDTKQKKSSNQKNSIEKNNLKQKLENKKKKFKSVEKRERKEKKRGSEKTKKLKKRAKTKRKEKESSLSKRSSRKFKENLHKPQKTKSKRMKRKKKEKSKNNSRRNSKDRNRNSSRDIYEEEKSSNISSSSLELSSISFEETRRPRKPRRRTFGPHGRKHFDTTSSDTDSEDLEKEDYLRYKERKKQERMARARMLEWERKRKEEQKEASSQNEFEDVQVGELQETDMLGNKIESRPKQKSSSEKSNSEPEDPIEAAEARLKGAENVFQMLAENPDINEAALAVAQQNLDDLRDQLRRLKGGVSIHLEDAIKSLLLAEQQNLPEDQILELKKKVEDLKEKVRIETEEKIKKDLENKIAIMEAEEKEKKEKEEKEGGKLQKLMGIEEINLEKNKNTKNEDYFIKHKFMDELEADDSNPTETAIDSKTVDQTKQELLKILHNNKQKSLHSSSLINENLEKNKDLPNKEHDSENSNSGFGRLRLDEDNNAPTFEIFEEEKNNDELDVENPEDEEIDPLDAFMSQIEGVKQETFNSEAIRNQNRSIEDRKEGDLGTIIEENEDDEEEIAVETQVMTQEQLAKMFGNEIFQPDQNMAEKDSDGFFVPRTKDNQQNAVTHDENTEEKKNQKNEIIENQDELEEEKEEEEEVEYDEEDSQFIQALKNSNLLFSAASKAKNVEDPNRLHEEELNKKKSEEPELCGDQEVKDKERITKSIKRNGGMESSAQSIDKIRSSYLERKQKIEKRKRLKRIDHSSILYDNIRKDLYREALEISNMTETEVAQKRQELGNIKIRGINPVKPIFSWYHCGLPRRILTLLVDKLAFKNPFPIQCQCIPVILSGRDCIGVAETGSGKTLAYVIPMLRHIKAQSKLKEGDGPIGLVLVPTRELATQVYSTTRLFGRALGIRAAAIFGGSSIGTQFSELKKGAEIVVSTPGRLIDILTTSKGKITNLRRVTFVVLDEADRMFDLGFEPQINRILGNIRPSKQTVLFSATFPRNIE